MCRELYTCVFFLPYSRKCYLFLTEKASPSFFSSTVAPSALFVPTTEGSSEKLPDKLSRLLAADRLDGLDGTDDRESAVEAVVWDTLITWGL